ncbi:MAG: hypothetical protein AB1938_23835 [Myxococcota bacterium]
MTRWTLLALAGLGLSACFNFDAAYDAYCDAGHCAGGGAGGGGGDAGAGGGTGGGLGGGTGGGGTGGGGTGGGGTGGGVGGGAGGGVGGGMGGGDGGTDAGVDAGCPNFLCPVDALTLARTSYNGYWTVTPGVIAESVERYQLWASYQTNMSGSDDYDHFEYWKVDGGFVEVDRSFEYGTGFEAKVSKGTFADRWTGTRGYIRHYVDDLSVVGYGDCTTADGGVNDPWWYGLEVFSPTDVLFVGYPFVICRWTPATGLVELVDSSSAPNVYLNDAHRTASGAEFVVGGEWTSSMTYAISGIWRTDGTAVSAPNDLDPNDDGWVEIDGVGDEAWVASHSGLIARLMPDGGFESVFDAGFGLRSLDVRTATDVWAVGDNGSRAAVFDGGAWGLVQLPSSATQPTLVWERVVLTDDGVILTGFSRTSTNLKSVVHSYRRFGK